MAGSYGTLAALEEVTVKVLPRPESVATVLFAGLEPAAASRLMAAALGSPHEVSGAAYLPPATSLPVRAGSVALRGGGPAPSVAFRRASLLRAPAAAVTPRQGGVRPAPYPQPRPHGRGNLMFTVPNASSPPRKRGSRAGGRIPQPWIPAFAGMTIWFYG